MAVLLVLVAIAVIGIYLYRDSIARKVANSVLRESDLAVIGLSIDSIGTNNIFFDELVLEQSNGARIRVTGIALPINVRGAQRGLLRVDGLEIISADGSDQPVRISEILASILELPQNVPYSAVHISRITSEGLPALTAVSWESTEAGQLLHFDIGSFAITAGIEPGVSGGHYVSITATTSDDVIAVALALVVEREDSGFVVSGQSTTRMAPLLPVLHAVGMLPVKITSFDTLLRGEVDTFIPDNPQVPIRVGATLTSDGEMSLYYMIDDQSEMQVQVLTYSPTTTMVEYPSLDWRAQVESGVMRVSTESVQDFPLTVTSLSCQAGINCSFQASINASDISLAGLAIASAEMTAPVSVSVSQQTQVTIGNNMKVVFRDVSNEEFTAESIELTEFSGATIDVDDDGWRGHSGTAHFLIGGINAQPGISGTFPLALSDVAISNSGNTITSAFLIESAATQLSFADFSWSMPDLAGTWQLAGDEFSARAALSSTDSAIQGQMELRHNLETSNGAIQIRDASLDFASRNLSEIISPSPKNWDVSAGRGSVGASLSWFLADESYQLTGSAQVGLDSIAGFKDDIVLTGLTTTLNASVNTQTGHEFQPTSLSLELLDVGLPLSDIAVEFQIGADLSSVQVDELSMRVLGGTMRADPFDYSTEATATPIMIRLESIQLALMMSLAEFDSIDIEGSISGVLPASIIGDHITVDKGRLESDDPGGAIRYRAGSAGADDSELGLVTRALSNFEYTTLTSDVTYTEDGDLLLGMRLEGVNPEMDPTQPVVLNLNVENNIPKMLRSLQATRSIQEIFERRMNKE
jgi:hypothetical protein